MKPNEGNLDRILRLVLGIGIAAYGIATGSWLGLLAIVPLGTAAIGFCPLYRIFGFSTCPLHKQGT
ncbi:MAG: DUF2892 domain-containing protein [Candidatus Melainabacteria bacterium HGW-Melainabacteria-1]|nr:MAG: DUF2892 domain-containing protein [Candidatus Melainabacteria bacterium HGW-Melainabacteria-1]